MTEFSIGFRRLAAALALFLAAGMLRAGALTAYASPMAEAAAQTLPALGQALKSQGWTGLTALNVMLLCLFHFPCSTTLITLYRETRSRKWTLAAFLLPTLLGAGLCLLTTPIAKIL